MAKKVKEQEKTQERILLFNNWSRKKDIEKVLSNVIDIANNTVIPICEALHMPLVKPNILKWVEDEDAFREAFVAKCKLDAANGNRYLEKIVEDSAYDDFDNQLKFHPYPVFRGATHLSDDEAKMVEITSRGGMIWDDDKLTEYTNVYLTDPAQIEVYHRIENICKVLDDFFGDGIPANNALNSWASIVYPTPKGFKVNPRIEFKNLIIKKK